MTTVVSCITLISICNEKDNKYLGKNETRKINKNDNQITQFLTDAISSISIISLVTFAYMRTNGICTSSICMTTAMCCVALINVCNEINIIYK